jgi:hypothetical protein
MKTTHRIASQFKRHQLALHSNPVAKAFARADRLAINTEAARNFADQLLTTRLCLLSADDGSDATELLSRLAVVIGAPCEAGARLGIKDTWVRQLHGALRTIQAMCLNGYVWQSQYALALDRAIEVAGEERHELDAQTFQDAWLDACALSTQIMNHTVSADAVAA